MGSLVWSTTGASSQGAPGKAGWGPTPQARTLTHQGVSQALSKEPWETLCPCPLPGQSSAVEPTPTPALLPAPPPKQSALSASDCQPAFLFRVLPLWSQTAPWLVGTWACNYLQASRSSSGAACLPGSLRTSWRPEVRLIVTSEGPLHWARKDPNSSRGKPQQKGLPSPPAGISYS